MHSAFAVGFAYMGARVVYGLGRQVAAARELGSYRLVERLGQGGMGEVWRAQHRMLARPAAIKLIRPSLTGTRRDRRAVAPVRARGAGHRPASVAAHGGAVRFRRRGRRRVLLRDGAARGARRRHARAALRPGAARAGHPYLLRQVCHSLSEAESCGLVHRDIKPANIFLCRYGEDHDFVKVLDFGIVKAREDRGGAEPALTRRTPCRARRPSSRRSRRWRTAGRPRGHLCDRLRRLLAADRAAGLHRRHADGASHASRPHAADPAVDADRAADPPALDALMMACLAKDPAERPQTARELSRRLADVEGAGGWTEDRAREWWGQHQPARS